VRGEGRDGTGLPLVNRAAASRCCFTPLLHAASAQEAAFLWGFPIVSAALPHAA